MRVYKLLVLLLLSPIGLAAYPLEIDYVSVFAQSKAPSPGCSIAVARDGMQVSSFQYGQANLEYGIEITADTVFNVGSVSKQFTAAAIGRLILDGKIATDSEIQNLLPDLPAYMHGITVDHLVRHTSGIRDSIPLVILKGYDWFDALPISSPMEILGKQRALNFQPGSAYVYSNSGYYLLWQIVEAASGSSLQEYTNTHLFEPAGMTSTLFRTDLRLIENRAMSYERKGNRWHNVFMRSTTAGAGGLYTTSSDLLRWRWFLHQPENKELSELLHTTSRLSDGTPDAYAYGISNVSYRGKQSLLHSGSAGGYRATLSEFPADNLVIAIACNRADISALSEAVLLAHQLIPELKPVVASQGDSKQKKSQYVGTYEIYPGVTMEIELGKADQLHVAAGGAAEPLEKIATDHYWNTISQAEFSFSRSESGKIDGINDSLHALERFLPKIPPEQPFDSKEYVGRYMSAELEVVYELKMDGDALQVRRPYTPPRQLISRKLDELEARGMRLFFRRDDQNQIVGFSMDGFRFNGIIFEKL